MDFIWVPESGSGNSASEAGSPLANEFSLFLCGFVVLAGCAAYGSFMPNEAIAEFASKRGMMWVVNLGVAITNIFPLLGYIFATTGALVGVSRSAAPMKSRWIWFAATQSVAAGLWFASTLH